MVADFMRYYIRTKIYHSCKTHKITSNFNREMLNQINLNQMSHKTFNCEIFNKSNCNQISHRTINCELFNQTNYNQISHKTFNCEISNQTNLNQISHETVKFYIFLIRPTILKYLIKLLTMIYLIRHPKSDISSNFQP